MIVMECASINVRKVSSPFSKTTRYIWSGTRKTFNRFYWYDYFLNDSVFVIFLLHDDQKQSQSDERVHPNVYLSLPETYLKYDIIESWGELREVHKPYEVECYDLHHQYRGIQRIIDGHSRENQVYYDERLQKSIIVSTKLLWIDQQYPTNEEDGEQILFDMLQGMNNVSILMPLNMQHRLSLRNN